jgi:hypothetical protein
VALSFDQRVSIPDSVMFRELEGEAVILDLDSESYFGLDEVGTRMWQLLTASESIREAHAALLAEFEVDADTLRTDMEELLDDLISKRLLEVHDDAA